MSWHYRLRKRSDKGEVYYDIVEYFPGLDSWTQDSIAPISETQEGMEWVLKQMLKDVKHYPVLDRNEEESS
jgi:hypothetical protein